jgi:hypothetical protein
MSTKTTFKRLALVTAVALGLGVVSSVSANAVQALSMSLSKTSLTAVGGAAGSSFVTVGVTVTSDTASTGLSAGETVTASVAAVPTSVTTTKTLAANAADISFQELKGFTNNAYPDWTITTADTPSGQSSTDGQIGSANTGFYGTDANITQIASSVKYRTYYMAIKCAANCMDQGVYTINFDLTNTAGATVQRIPVKVDFVTAAASSGALLTATSVGQWSLGDTPSIANQNYAKYMTVTLTNRDGGALRTNTGAAPTISTVVNDSSTSPIYQTMSNSDAAGSNEVAYDATNGVDNQAGDGVYSVYNASAWTAAKVGVTLTARYGLSVSTTTVSLVAAATASTVGTASWSSTGSIQGSDSDHRTIPLTTNSVTFKNTVTVSSTAQTGYATYYTLSYSGCVLGDMSVAASSTPVKVLTDASGVASLTITDLNPVSGCTATVTWSGAATNPNAQVAAYASATPTTVLASTGSYQSLVGSTNKITFTVLDQFSNPVVGKTATFAIGGANAPASTTTAPSAVTDANGQVAYSFTDKAGIPADATYGTTTVALGTVNAVTPTTNPTVTITYKTALSAVASLYGTYSATNKAGTAISGVVPTSVIGSSTIGIAVSAADQLDLTKALTGATTGPWVALTYTAKDASGTAVTGVPTTFSVVGAQLIGSDGKLAKSTTVYANDTVYILGTTVGTATVTATNGSNVATATINYVNVADQDERVVAGSEKAGVVTFTVTDAFGNPVSGASLDVTSTGGALLGSGATFGVYKTASDGTVAISITGAGSVTAKNTNLDKTTYLAGYGGTSTTSAVTTGAPAGVRSVTLTTSGVANATLNATNTAAAAAAALTQSAIDAAQAATDAANEATDAANAATDAANNAMDSADAAQQAALDAGDKADAALAAVTDLATKVSDIASSISALSALVAKISASVAKISAKVKA